MTFSQRIILSVLILLVDSILFFIPLTAIFLVYVLLVNPPWFRLMLERNADREKERSHK